MLQNYFNHSAISLYLQTTHTHIMKKGSHHSQESKDKNKAKHLGKTQSDATKAIRSEQWKGDRNPMKRSDVKAKISLRMQKENPMFNPTVCAQMAATKKGTTLSDKHIESIRNSTKEALADPEVRARMSKSHEGIPRPQWVRDKIGKGNKGKIRSVEARKKISCTRKGIPLEEFINFSKFEPYCEKFDEILKDNVRSFFGKKCALCHKNQRHNIDKRGKYWKLSVHHVYIEKLACCETVIEEKDEVRKRLPLHIAQFGNPDFSKEEIKYIRMMVPLCLHCHGLMNGESDDIPYDKSKYRKFFTELILSRYGGNSYSRQQTE